MPPRDESAEGTWQVVRVTGIGSGELWFDEIQSAISKSRAQRKAKRSEEYIAIPESEVPDDWGQKWLDDELESDPYAQ